MDDVHYLKKHASEESFLFLVDSSMRDTSVYPLPNEYEIQFNSPFRNVIGLDLIDASIPRTEYLVEAGSNSLVYTHAPTGDQHTLAVPPGDYNSAQLVEAINEAAKPMLGVQAASSPNELSNRVYFVSDAPFTIHSSKSSLKKVLGLGVTDLTSFAVAGALGTATVVTGPLPTQDEELVTTFPIRQTFVATAEGVLTAARLYAHSPVANTLIDLVVVDAETGNTVAAGTMHTGVSDFEQLTASLTATSSCVPGKTYHVVVSSPNGDEIYVSTNGLVLSRGVTAPNNMEWSEGEAEARMSLDLDMAMNGHVAECPGLVNLTGERYVLIRCPEIEQQLYRDRAYEKVHAGMGMVKLGGYGFQEQRYDFVSFPPRRMTTPIGKLGKLTFKLEKSDGTAYDTHGIDHHMLLVVRYLEMTATPDMSTTILNPNYAPHIPNLLTRGL